MNLHLHSLLYFDKSNRYDSPKDQVLTRLQKNKSILRQLSLVSHEQLRQMSEHLESLDLIRRKEKDRKGLEFNHR